MNVNPVKWFSVRELDKVPPHFIKASTPISDKAKLWVITKLEGRYAIAEGDGPDDFLLISPQYIFFEDPSEATMFELRWAGSK
jgi:hypothetical protein